LIATNTIPNNGDGGLKAVTDTSDVVKVVVTHPGTTSAILIINKDDERWRDCGKIFTLKFAENETIYHVMTGANGMRSTTIDLLYSGLWKLYDGEHFTEVEFTITPVDAVEILNYYTVLFSLVELGSAKGSTISATYGGNEIPNDTIVLGGKTLVITANGQGADSYTYGWSVNGTDSATTSNSISIADLLSKIDAICTITGITGSDNANIVKITVDGEDANRSGNNFSITAECGRNFVTVFVEVEDPNAAVEIGGVVQNPRLISLPFYSQNSIGIKVTAQNGDVANYTLMIEKLIPFEKITVVRWGNTIAVLNNPAYNGGFRFFEFQWFRNDDVTPFSTDQWWSADKIHGGPLDTTNMYHVVLRTSGDCCGSLVPVTIRSCRSRINLITSIVAVSPNPIHSGEPIYVEVDVDDELLNNTVIEVYSATGARITQLKPQERITPINLNLPAGVYVIVITDHQEFRREMKAIVR